MDEELEKLDQKKSKWWVWVIVTAITLVVVVGAAYIWANKPYEKLVDKSSYTNDFDDSTTDKSVTGVKVLVKKNLRPSQAKATRTVQHLIR